MTEDEDSLAQIAREEARLAELDKLREGTEKRLLALRRHARDHAGEPSIAQPLTVLSRSRSPSTTEEKLKLFRQLFRGRHDVFPKHWVNAKRGTKGYAPACFNEWVKGLCNKPEVQCGACPNQAFIPLDDRIILHHLQGRHIVGVYPLLQDETCWFLAVDLDKGSWKEDVLAFVETCRTFGAPAAVERSRSGNGAHVWFFFSAPVPAKAARKMGCYLITETMARRHELSMDSYDRLFPSQDTLPRGGFGNLIALPLHYGALRQGNTVFLDERLDPYPEQWAYLAAVPRMAPSAVEALSNEATRQGRVIGVRLVEPLHEADEEPWTRPPSGRPRRVEVPGPLPPKVRAVLAQRLFVEKTALPSALLNQIKRVAAFQNPEFYKKQSLRLSTATTPRVIACAEELPEHISLPRGCRAEVEDLLKEHGVLLTVDDQRRVGEPLDLCFRGDLTPVQEEAARALLAHDTGVFVAPPGIGKTVVGVYLVARRATSALILVHRRHLLDQWVAHLSMFLGIEEKSIGRIGGGKRKPNGKLDVAMSQSLVRKGRVDDLVAEYGQVIVDECHHVPAVSFERILSEVKGRYLVGLTATPERRDGHHPITAMQLGPIRFTVSPKSEHARRPFEHLLIARETAFHFEGANSELTIQDTYGALATDEARNLMIIDDVIHAMEEGRSPILVTERRDHLELLAARLRGIVRHLVVLQGGMSANQRRDIAARLAAIPDEEERLILATGRYIGEGFDDARLDTLFLALPVSWKGILVQYTGRLHRLHPKKTEVRIYDYVDRQVPKLLRMFENRLRGYRAIGYARGEAPVGCEEPIEETTIEWDEEALRHFDDSA